MPLRRRIWSEHVPLERATAPEVLAALAARDVQLVAAIFPQTVDEAPEWVGRCREAGVSVGLWPMIADAEGRWASVKSAARYAEFAHRVLERTAGDLPDTLAVDLEPPIAEVRRILAGDPRPILRHLGDGGWAAAARRLADVVSDARGRGVETLAALVPPLGTPFGAGLEHALGTPYEEPGFDRLGAMAYTTLMRGYSRHVIRRRDVLALLHLLSAGSVEALGPRAALSLGAVGTGALEDEAVYESPAELAEDVAVARHAGIEDLALFDLGGVLARPPIEAWLSAFTDTPPATAAPPLSRRARLFRSALGASAHAVSAWKRARSGRRPGRR